MPLHQPIEGGHGPAEMGGEIRPCPMGLLLKAADSSEHKKDRFAVSKHIFYKNSH